ncbi:PTS sugar transporter subunit IIB [Collinsella provencensis]|uniref:PTS sugar transporter subunit IIB n=1 Tax=Collinsella provencensis TaxID=1937461 RepID=UPI000C8343DE|nr:PTS sugar transporter subunit IIB [Collinsella provencensis]
MKKIVLACGSGIATSTAVAQKVSTLLDEKGFKGQYHIVQCAIAEAASQCADADLLIATTVAPAGITCEFVSGLPFLTGMGLADTQQKILDIVSK